MEIAKLTSKGQLTIPKEVRDALGLQTGDKVLFVEKDGGYWITKDAPRRSNSVNIDGICASLALEDIPTTEEMLDYAAMRLSHRTTYASKVAEIAKRYQHVR